MIDSGLVLVGRNDTGNIYRCYSTAYVDAAGDHNGGLVGANDFNSVITDCYSTGNIVGYEEEIGGLVGTNNHNSEIINCYSTGNVSGGTNYVGGLVGRTLNGAVTTDSFWDTESSGQSTSAGGTGKTTLEMQTQSTFTDAGWDFVVETVNGTDDIWKMITAYNNGYPILNWETFLPVVATTTASSVTQNSASSGGEVTNDGDANVTARGVCWGTTINPTIADSYTNDGTGTGSFTSNLTGLSFSTIYYYRAYATNSVGTSYGEEYSFLTTPAGTGTSGDPYQISTLAELRWISENSSTWNKHIIQTADINAADTQNWNSGAGFSPIGNNSIRFSGDYDGQGFELDGLFINRPSTNYQGLFGFTEGAEISNLGITNVTISGNDYTGGLVGLIYYYSTVTNCYSTGNVSGGVRTGGLVGFNSTIATITNCFSMGSVSGNAYIGGLVGLNYSYVSNSYSTGVVSGIQLTGGLVGHSSGGSVNNSFWDTQTSGQSSSSGGTGKATAEMQTRTTFTDVGWDFIGETANGTDDIWVIFPSNYPTFTREYEPPLITSIADIPNDQGRNVSVTWDRSSIDVYGSSYPIVSYNLWIEYPFDTRGCSITTDIDEVVNSSASSFTTARKNILLLDREGEIWMIVLNLAAMQWESYTAFTQTFQDSSTTTDNPSTFFVSAHTTIPSVYFSSDVMSGYSLDNIAPDATENLDVIVNSTSRSSVLTLTWNEVSEGTWQGNSYPEINGIWYKLYAGNEPDFICDGTTYLTTTQDLTYEADVTGFDMMFFKIVVSDQPDANIDRILNSKSKQVKKRNENKK